MILALGWLSRQGGTLFPASLLLGLLLPAVAALLRPSLWTVVLLLTFTVMLRMDFSAALADFRRPGAIIAVSVLVLLVSPPLTWAAARLLGLDAGLAAALVITAAAPPITSAPAFARIMGLDAAFALAGSVAGMLATPLTAPPLALSLTGIDLALSVPQMAARLAFFVATPLAAALAARAAAQGWIAARAAAIDGTTVLLLSVFAVAVMDGVAALALDAPRRMAELAGASFLLNWGFFALGTLLFRVAGMHRALTAGLMAGNRQMALMLAVLPDSAPQDVKLFLAVAQIPLYLNPFLLRPLLRRLLHGS